MMHVHATMYRKRAYMHISKYVHEYAYVALHVCTLVCMYVYMCEYICLQRGSLKEMSLDQVKTKAYVGISFF